MFELTDLQMATMAGFGGGALLGLAARVGRFCVMGAVEDAVYGGDLGRIRMLALAAAVAIAGSFLLIGAGLLDPNATLYFHSAWSPAGSVIGGLLFGIGMSLVGTCAFGSLARAGGGDLRGVIIACTVGVTGYATASGPLRPLLVWLLPPDRGPGGAEFHGLAHLAGATLGISPVVPALAVAAIMAAWVAWDRRFRRPGRHLVWSVAAGLAIVIAWAATSRLAMTGFDPVPVESFSFVAPIGEGVLYLMTAASTAPDFAVGAVAGVVAGAALGSIVKGEFRWEACDDARELRRQILGAMMMGVGGMLALGCTIGQGLSALSLLATSAPVSILAIMTGARLGLYWLVEGAPGGHHPGRRAAFNWFGMFRTRRSGHRQPPPH